MIEAGGDMYERLTDGWYRVSQDGTLLGKATKREARLLGRIEELKQVLKEAAWKGFN